MKAISANLQAKLDVNRSRRFKVMASETEQPIAIFYLVIHATIVQGQRANKGKE